MMLIISAIASIAALIFSISDNKDGGKIALIIFSVVQFLLICKLSKAELRTKMLKEEIAELRDSNTGIPKNQIESQNEEES